MVEEIIVEKIGLPEGISATVSGNEIMVNGKAGSVKKVLSAKGISFRLENSSIVVEARPATRKMNALLRTIKSHVVNMVEGAGKGYEYKLAIVFSHFPMTVKVKEKTVEIMNFAGEKRPRTAKIIGQTKVDVKGKDIIVSGTDKDAAGQTAANLENATRITGKDRRIYQDGIYFVEKAGSGAPS